MGADALWGWHQEVLGGRLKPVDGGRLKPEEVAEAVEIAVEKTWRAPVASAHESMKLIIT